MAQSNRCMPARDPLLVLCRVDSSLLQTTLYTCTLPSRPLLPTSAALPRALHQSLHTIRTVGSRSRPALGHDTSVRPQVESWSPQTGTRHDQRSTDAPFVPFSGTRHSIDRVCNQCPAQRHLTLRLLVVDVPGGPCTVIKPHVCGRSLSG